MKMSLPQEAPAIPGYQPGKKALLVFFETDCPTCQLALPYLNALKGAQVIGLSQDDEAQTRDFVRQMAIAYPVVVDQRLQLSRAYDPQSVPAVFLLDEQGRVVESLVGFDKNGLNELAAGLGHPPIAPADDGAPSWKPGCGSRHLEPRSEETVSVESDSAPLLRRIAQPAQRITLGEDEDLVEFCYRRFGDALPVVPPTAEKVAAMLQACSLS